MTDLASHLNGFSTEDATQALRRCCASKRWVSAMADLRPFEDRAAVHSAAEETWGSLEEADWLEAFRAHPRIGAVGLRERWSRAEQAGVAGASEDVLQALDAINGEYENRFGFIFLICASGLTADAMLEALQARLTGSRDEELRIAASEHAKITALRLDRLVDEG